MPQTRRIKYSITKTSAKFDALRLFLCLMLYRSHTLHCSVEDYFIKPKERNLHVCRMANVQVRGGGGYLTIQTEAYPPPTVKLKERNLHVCRMANVQVRGSGGYLTIKLKFIRPPLLSLNSGTCTSAARQTCKFVEAEVISQFKLKLIRRRRSIFVFLTHSEHEA